MQIVFNAQLLRLIIILKNIVKRIKLNIVKFIPISDLSGYCEFLTNRPAMENKQLKKKRKRKRKKWKSLYFIVIGSKTNF